MREQLPSFKVGLAKFKKSSAGKRREAQRWENMLKVHDRFIVESPVYKTQDLSLLTEHCIQNV